MSDAAAKSAGPKWEVDAKDSIRSGLRRYAKPLADLVARDANEGDTRLLVTDFLCDALGYDKYEDLTTEFAVRGEFADYGIRVDQQLVAFIEVKRAAQQLGARHLRQVETYAVKEGLEWVLLTNGRVWQAYNVRAGNGQQVATTLALEVDLLGDETPSKKIAKLFHLHRSALKRSTGAMAAAGRDRSRGSCGGAAVDRGPRRGAQGSPPPLGVQPGSQGSRGRYPRPGHPP